MGKFEFQQQFNLRENNIITTNYNPYLQSMYNNDKIMDSITNDFGLICATPNKRKHLECEDVIVTPSSSYDSDECNTPDENSYPSTPCESPIKRRKTANFSQLSPPLMPRLSYQPALNERSNTYARGRPFLDLFANEDNELPENDLSFLAIPAIPPQTSGSHEEEIPSFGLSPRTTLIPRFSESMPRFPEIHDSYFLDHETSDNNEDKENNGVSKTRRPLRLPSLRMRPTLPPWLERCSTWRSCLRLYQSYKRPLLKRRSD